MHVQQFRVSRSAREKPVGTLTQSGYTQPHGDKGHLIHHFRLHHTELEYFYRLVYSVLSFSLLCCVHTVLFVQSLAFPKKKKKKKKLVQLALGAFPDPSLPSPHLVLTFFDAYLHDSEWTGVYPPVYPCHVR